MEPIDFLHPHNNTDQILVVEGHNLNVHRCILSMWSSYFKAMFNGNFKETNCEKINLHGKKYLEIVEMLKIIYDRTHPVKEDTFEFLLQLADEYQMPLLKDLCKQFIKTANKNDRTISMKFLHAIHTYQLNDIENCCDNFIEQTVSTDVRDDEIYNYICTEAKLYFLEKRLDYTEKKLDNIINCSSKLLDPLFKSAFESYTHYLNDKNMRYNANFMNYFLHCDNESEHTKKRPGQYFDSNCKKCRQKIGIAEAIQVSTAQISKTMDELKTMI